MHLQSLLKTNVLIAMLRISFIILIVLAFFSCEKFSDRARAEYYNSFEKESDLSDLQGLAEQANISAPGGGDHSLFVSGGCILPHTWIELGPWDETKKFELRGWAKTVTQGSISMFLTDDPVKRVEIEASDSTWTHYFSSSTLKCPAHMTITLELNSGGFMPGGMWVDELEIVDIK